MRAPPPAMFDLAPVRNRARLAALGTSVACVGLLTYTLGHGAELVQGGLAQTALPEGSLATTALGLAAGLVVLCAAALHELRRERAQTVDLVQRLTTANALVAAEPQVLISWEPGTQPVLITHSLPNVPGLPTTAPQILTIDDWVEPELVAALREHIDLLFVDGHAFNVIVRTVSGGHLEADGRAGGGRVLLRLRDVAGTRRELGLIQDLQRQLSRDIRASRGLIDALPMPAWMKDADGRIFWVNKAYVSAVEAASDTEVVERQLELLETRQRRDLERALLEGRDFVRRLPLIVGGRAKSHDVVALDTGEAVAACALDVEPVELAARELHGETTAYDHMLDRIGIAVAVFDREQRLTYHNKAYLALWGLGPDWLASGPTDGAILDELRKRRRLPEVANYRDWKSKMLAPYATPGEQDERWHLPDGRTIHVLSGSHGIGGVTTLYVDETGRLALESRLNALVNVQRETLDGLNEGVAVFATDGRLKLFNKAFAGVWRLSPSMLQASPHIDAFISAARSHYDEPRVWDRIGRAVTSFSLSREPVTGQMLRPDHSVIDFALTPLPDGATLLTFADVTDAKRYERALVERNEALIAADRVKNQFIGHVSYELRTPLNDIIGFSEFLSSAPHLGPLSAKQREYLDDIAASSRTLRAIIDDILDLATIDAGALELKLKLVEVRAIIEDAIGGIAERAEAGKLTLDVAVADDAGHIHADEARLRQVLYNLLSNAVGFSKPGGTVSLTAWREARDMLFVVEDQGTGIPLADQANVFERFESKARGSNHRGAGLGLPIVKSLTGLHGGTVSLVSEPQKGTRVTVRIPGDQKGSA